MPVTSFLSSVEQDAYTQPPVFSHVEPKNGCWLAYNPSLRLLLRLLRANVLLTNWVSISKTVRAELVEA